MYYGLTNSLLHNMWKLLVSTYATSGALTYDNCKESMQVFLQKLLVLLFYISYGLVMLMAAEISTYS